MKKIRKIAATAALAAAAVAAAAAPALASVPAPAPAIASAHVMFVVIVNGAVDVTSQHLTAGQVVYRGGIAEHVAAVDGHAARFIPAVTGPGGAVIQFST